jgi:hypothetical protein
MQEENAMNFKKATDELLEHPTLEDLANDLGVSLQSIRQARAERGSTAYRAPPPGWEEATRRLAESSAAYHQRLAKKLRRCVG